MIVFVNSEFKGQSYLLNEKEDLYIHEFNFIVIMFSMIIITGSLTVIFKDKIKNYYFKHNL